MKRITSCLLAVCFTLCFQATAQKLPARWDEITAADWNNALAKSNKTCILPIGILEKHGPHVPMGSDLIRVREYAARATQKEYAVVFPDYFYGQINEAKHQPGVFALPERVVWDMLENTCDEIARNGFTKIIIVNGHGGNPELIKYFIQTRLEKERNYAVYFFQPSSDSTFNRQVNARRRSDARGDQHAGEKETSEVLYFRPELVQLDSAKNESGANQNRLSIPNVYTGIWWYADYPNHYAGEGDKATTALGKLIADHTISQLIEAIKAIKSDDKTLKLQKEFFDRVRK
ncbi:MAG: creatininase family protein [Bacteroidota bacterium]